jgi:hypothetical protein
MSRNGADFLPRSGVIPVFTAFFCAPGLVKMLSRG